MSESVDDRLIAKLRELDHRYEDLHRQLADPKVASDPNQTVAIAKLGMRGAAR